jgi:glycosyltransferase involved in cell wall biosynthesis
MIRVLHIVEGFSPQEGGVTTMVKDLIEACGNNDIKSTVVALGQGLECDAGNNVIRVSGFKGNAADLFRLTAILDLYRIMVKSQYDILHIHGVWLPIHILGAFFSRVQNKHAIASMHGMLEKWVWEKNGRLKEIFRKFYFYLLVSFSFRNIKCFHAITLGEQKSIRYFFPSSDPIIIPNGINSKPYAESKCPGPMTDSGVKRILFVGRIHPVKGLHLLIDAIATLEVESGFILDIVGPEEDLDYAKHIREKCREYDLSLSIRFHGGVFNLEEKILFYKQAWICVVPSWSEVIGLVNLEAAASSCPTITTRATGLYDWADGGGLLISPSVNELTKALTEALDWSLEERVLYGKRISSLQNRKYDLDVTIKQWVDLYRSIYDS